MKYEKFLKQLCLKATDSLSRVHQYTGEALYVGESKILRRLIRHVHANQMSEIEALNRGWIRHALEVPKSFVEKSRRPTAHAILEEWTKENEGQK